MSFLDPQNPGIGGLDELTDSEALLVQQLNSLGDPGADRILFWDESANAYAFLTVGSGLTITNTTIDVTGGGSVDGSGTTNELVYWVDSNTLGALAVATYPSLTELSYVKGVTSAIQTQINTKANSSGSLTQFVGNTAFRVFYSDTNGDITELALGADGTFLKSNGAGVAPSFATPAGSGDVSKVGTPVDNQIGVWTGDGTIEGQDEATFKATVNLEIGVDVQAYDADLTTWAGLTPSANAQSLVTAANYAAMRTLLDLEAGTDFYSIAGADAAFQPKDADLTTIAGLTATTDNFIVSVASAWASRTPAQVRTTLGIGTAGLVATDLADLNEATIEGAIDTLANLTSIQGRTITLADAGADAFLIWDDSASAYQNSSQADARTILGLGTAALVNTGTSGATIPLLNGANTWGADQTVPDEAYGAGWNGSLEVPTKNAVYDKIETLGGSASATTKTITQVAHGFAVNDVIKFSGSTYQKAQANSAANAEVVGIVTAVADADNFTFAMEGYVTGLSALTSDTVYFLSAGTAGLLTATEPSTVGQISKPVLKTVSTTAGVINNMRGIEITTPEVNPSAVTIMPQPNYFSTAATTPTWNSNTTGYTSQFILPFEITVNKISINIDSTPTDGTIKIGVYSEDGQTKEIDVTTATLSAIGLYTTAVSAVTLSAGVHYIVIVPVSTTSVTAFGYAVGTGMDTLNPVTSEPKIYGTQTVSAGTLPATFTPSSITDSTNGAMPYFRLDN